MSAGGFDGPGRPVQGVASWDAPLPIDEALPALAAALAERTGVVLHAPPGAGKTTRVPLALLDAPWLAGQKVLLLEPRRLAARAAARRMATTLREAVGGTVGYRMRMETRVGPTTRIEVVTEGVLTRFLHDDPALDGVGLVIFDEFHERSLHADLGLALTLQTQRVLREELRILVMSATLDTEGVARLIGDAQDGTCLGVRQGASQGAAPVVSSEGRSFPVDVRYRPAVATHAAGTRSQTARVEAATVSAVREALANDVGDILVFLPGASEIRRTAASLNDGGLPDRVHVAPLYGALSQEAQDDAIAPSPPGSRKVVLATSIAETSLTIEGVRVVIDSGLSRVPRFSPGSGMTRLDTVRVSRASAEQRCGRAGRVAPGVCYRVWDAHEQSHLVPHGTPEILDADLAPLALDLAATGIADPATLDWMDVPPTAAFAQARALLAQLGALDAEGRITAHGQRMAELPVHPRLAHMLLSAARLGHLTLACDIAAVLSERDILITESGVGDADLRLRLDALAGDRSTSHGMRVDHAGRQRVRAQARELRRIVVRTLRAAGESVDEAPSADAEFCGLALAFAYPDRIAQRRPGSVTAQHGGRFLLRSGRGAALPTPQSLSASEYLVVAETDGQSRESRIFLAAPIARADIEAHFASDIVAESRVEWDDDASAVRARVQERLGALVLADAPLRNADPVAIQNALLHGITSRGLTALPWTESARALQARIHFLHHRHADWPDVSDTALAETMETWLAPQLEGMTTLDEVRRIDMTAVLGAMLTWQQRTALDTRAPAHYTAPTGSRIPLDYSDPDAPVLAVRLQEMFGVADTPRIDQETVQLTVHLLSPAHRPVQVTRDLAGFWRTSYFDVKKELKGRYPKHVWPDDPLATAATRYTKARTATLVEKPRKTP